jgi:hypothetical protein
MPIHPKTLKIYEENDFQYHFDPEDKAHAEWLKKISDGKGGYNEHIKELVHSISRIKDEISGEEYIAWSGHWEGIQISELDKSRRKLTFPTSCKGPVLTWIEPQIDRGEPYFDMNKRKVSYPAPNETGRITRYERKFSEKAFEELMKKADPVKKEGVGLAVYYANGGGIGGQSAPIAIHDRDSFVHAKFEDICKVQVKVAALTPGNSSSTNTNTNTNTNTTTNKAS